MAQDIDFDPAGLGWPPTFPLEVAMREMPIRELCESYGLTKDDWRRLKDDPKFVAAVQRHSDELAKDGMSFQIKAKMQAEVLLKESWRMIHASDAVVPPTVKADLIKSTMKWAGFDNTAKAQQVAVGPALQINIQFHGKPPSHGNTPLVIEG